MTTQCVEVLSQTAAPEYMDERAPSRCPIFKTGLGPHKALTQSQTSLGQLRQCVVA